MRFHLATAHDFKRIAKDIKTELDRQGHPRPLGQCQNALARLYGYAHRDELLTDIGRNPVSPSDREVGEAVRSERLQNHQKMLSELLDLPATTALAAVVKAGPTRLDRNAPPSPSARLLLIDEDGWGGFALVGDGQIARGTTLFVSRGGEVYLGSGRKHAKTASQALQMKEIGRWNQVYLDPHLVAAVGLRPGIWMMQVEGATSAQDNTKQLEAAVALLRRGVEAPAFDAWVGLRDRSDFETYEMLRGNDRDGERLRAFATAYPDLFCKIVSEDGVKAILDADSPEQGLLHYLSTVIAGDLGDARRLQQRLRHLDWVPSLGRGVDLGAVLKILHHLPDHAVPQTRGDFEFFVRACQHLHHMTPSPQISAMIVSAGAHEGWGARLLAFEDRLYRLASDVADELGWDAFDDSVEAAHKGAVMVSLMFSDTALGGRTTVTRVLAGEAAAVDALFDEIREWCVHGAPADAGPYLN